MVIAIERSQGRLCFVSEYAAVEKDGPATEGIASFRPAYT